MNPFSYLFQNRISSLHEYIADAKAIKEHPKKQFFENLLNQSFQVEKFSFVNQFYKKSLIKKRIIMVTKNKSKEILKLKYLLVLPLLFSMILYTSCSKQEDIKVDEHIYNYKQLDKYPYIADTKLVDNDKRKMELILKVSSIIFNKVKQNSRGYIDFVIDEKGYITNVHYDNIEKENLEMAKQCITLLPKLKAGMKDGKPVKTQMSFPFSVTVSNEVEDDDSIPFSVIENVPVYPGCTGNNEKLKKCMSDKITKFVGKNFNVDLAQNLDLKEGKHRISVQFQIDKDGFISDVKARAPHPDLKDEAIRIINLLPKMKAGMSKGKNVNVRYNLPIVFKVGDGNDKYSSKANDNLLETESIPFSVIENVPVYPGCTGNNAALKNCMSSKITKFVSENFNVDLAQGLDLKAGKHRILVQFLIDKDGNIAEVKARAPHPDLKDEAIRIINLLPKMKAGMSKGKNVNVRYNLPIVFNVEENKGMLNGQNNNVILNKENLNDVIIQSKKGDKYFDVVSFKLKIPKKPSMVINGNKLTKEAIKYLKKMKPDYYMVVFDIKIKNSNERTSSIQFRVK